MRSAGLLMHISSLPSPGGIGDLGREAFAFADFLHSSGMTVWQVLPLGPTGYGESPYQSPSAFAGNPLMISPEKLREEGLLSYADEELYRPPREDRVFFDEVRENRTALLRRAFAQSGAALAEETRRFRAEQDWVEDYALFAALKTRYGGQSWIQWPDRDIRTRRPEALRRAAAELKEEVDFHVFCQYLFRKQWKALRAYCRDLGISLFGDMPIYVAEDSADTWTHPEVFQLDRNLVPTRVAGVPPDYFSEDGQLWGNPLYRWHRLRFRRYDWWVARMKGAAELYDMIRIDHFIGLANYYSIPYGAPNARNGKWIVGPGRPLLRRLRKEVPGIRIIAEDLGEVNDRVRRLMDWSGYPGMKVLCFGFDGDAEKNVHFPSHYSENYVCYTGTHDNNTVRGWYDSADPAAAEKARETLGFGRAEDAPWAFIRSVLSSPCDTAMIPVQDLLGLGEEARMNFPGTVGNNWHWRMMPGALTGELSGRVLRLMRETNRGGK